MAGVLLGNNYLFWVETATAGSFAFLKGQGTFTETRSQQKIDTSSKETTGYGTGAFGNIDWEGSLDLKVQVDANYTRLETMANTQSPLNVQIRKNGANGAMPADVIFAAQVYPNIASRAFNKDGTVDVKVSLMLAGAPTTDVLA